MNAPVGITQITSCNYKGYNPDNTVSVEVSFLTSGGGTVTKKILQIDPKVWDVSMHSPDNAKLRELVNKTISLTPASPAPMNYKKRLLSESLVPQAKKIKSIHPYKQLLTDILESPTDDLTKSQQLRSFFFDQCLLSAPELLDLGSTLEAPLRKQYLQSFFYNICNLNANEWGLNGNWDVDGIIYNLEGIEVPIMEKLIAYSVRNYFMGRSGATSSSRESLPAIDKLHIITALENSHNQSSAQIRLNHVRGEFITLSMQWTNQRGSHTVQLTGFGPFFSYTNRGETLHPDPNTTFYKLRIPFERYDIEKFDLKHMSKETIEGPIGLLSPLYMVPIYKLKKSPQKVGNCAWANTKGGFHNLLILSMLARVLAKNPQMDLTQAINMTLPLSELIYKEWEYEQRADSLANLCSIKSLPEFGNNSLPTRLYLRMINTIASKMVQRKHKKYMTPKWKSTTIGLSLQKIGHLLASFCRKNTIPLSDAAVYFKLEGNVPDYFDQGKKFFNGSAKDGVIPPEFTVTEFVAAMHEELKKNLYGSFLFLPQFGTILFQSDVGLHTLPVESSPDNCFIVGGKKIKTLDDLKTHYPTLLYPILLDKDHLILKVTNDKTFQVATPANSKPN